MEQLRGKSLYPDASCPHEPTQICSRDGKGSANQVRSHLHTACISVPPDRESGICHRIHQPPPKKLQVQRKKRNETSTCMSIYAPVCPSICPSVTLCIHLYTHVSIWASLCACASICVSIYARTGIYISSVCLSACLPAHLCACLCICLCVHLCVSPCIHLCAHLCIHLSVNLHIHLYIHLCAHLCIHMSICASACTSVCTSMHLPGHLSVCASMFPPVHPALHPPMCQSIYLPVPCCPLPLGVALPGSAICHPCTPKRLFHGPGCPHGESSRRIYMQEWRGWLMEKTQRCNQRENCLSVLVCPGNRRM